MHKKTGRILAACMTAAMVLGIGAVPIAAQTVTGDSAGASYSSTAGGENAVLVGSGSVTLTDPTVTKSGDSSGDDADFVGTNAAVLAKGGATLTMERGSVTTDGSHANGVFSYGTGTTVNISGTTISTSSNNSGGIMTTGGATMNAKDLTVITQGGSSAAIRSDRGGGNVTVTGGSYTTSGTGSPAIYSTADIRVSNAVLTSNTSEAAVIEGGNSIALTDCTVTADNEKLNGQASNYDNVLIYQSMSGDASAGSSSFGMTGGTMVCKNGYVFCITNTTAEINLSNADITSSDGQLLIADAEKWGKSGSNGGKVTLNAKSQKLAGAITIDSSSSLTLNLSENSSYSGAVNTSGQNGTVSVAVPSGCTWTLTGDSYVSSLTADDGTIQTNGHTLYVSGKAYASSESSSSAVRTGGEDRYETSEKIAEAAYPNGADCAIIASGEDFPDALCASSLAGLIGGPVLLSSKDSINSCLSKALSSLHIQKAVLVGGTGVLSENLKNELETAGLTVERIAGTDRVDTSLQVYATGEAVASEMTGSAKKWGTSVILASGESFADAVSISPYAAADAAPVLLAGSGGTPGSAVSSAAEKAENLIIVGGTGVVSSSADSLNSSYVRLSGSTRYETSAAIAEWLIGASDSVLQPSVSFSSLSVAFASGSSYPDSLSGSAYQAQAKSPLLLISSDSTESAAIYSFIKKNMPSGTSFRIFGGTGSVSQSVEDLINSAEA